LKKKEGEEEGGKRGARSFGGGRKMKYSKEVVSCTITAVQAKGRNIVWKRSSRMEEREVHYP